MQLRPFMWYINAYPQCQKYYAVAAEMKAVERLSNAVKYTAHTLSYRTLANATDCFSFWLLFKPHRTQLIIQSLRQSGKTDNIVFAALRVCAYIYVLTRADVTWVCLREHLPKETEYGG